MPRGDRTGPLGEGPKTGRGMGFCSGFDVPGFMNAGSVYGYGIGRGGGRGRGRGHRRMYYTTGFPGSVPWENRNLYGPPESSFEPAYHNMRKRDELRALKAQAENLKQSLDQINDRIGELTESANAKGD